MWRRRLCLAALLTALCGCGAAGASPGPHAPAAVNPDAPLAVRVSQQLSGQGLHVADVQCPAATPEEGTTATCTGSAAGVTLHLTVTFAAGNSIIVAAAP